MEDVQWAANVMDLKTGEEMKAQVGERNTNISNVTFVMIFYWLAPRMVNIIRRFILLNWWSIFLLWKRLCWVSFCISFICGWISADLCWFPHFIVKLIGVHRIWIELKRSNWYTHLSCNSEQKWTTKKENLRIQKWALQAALLLRWFTVFCTLKLADWTVTYLSWRRLLYRNRSHLLP